MPKSSVKKFIEDFIEGDFDSDPDGDFCNPPSEIDESLEFTSQDEESEGEELEYASDEDGFVESEEEIMMVTPKKVSKSSKTRALVEESDGDNVEEDKDDGLESLSSQMSKIVVTPVVVCIIDDDHPR